MAKRFRKKKVSDHDATPSKPPFKLSLWSVCIPLLLGVAAFLVYWPSLKSGLVYDAYAEIVEEGFITSLSNLPDVLSLKVLGMSNLLLGARPGQMLYLMLNAAIWDKDPFGYHLSSNLFHAANVVLLFVLLRRLIAPELAGLSRDSILKIQFAMATVTLIFALHPLMVESVSEVSYSSSLLVTFFTLLALLAATSFRPGNFRVAMLTGGMGTLCAFAAVDSKESGVTAATILIAYWFLFRRKEARLPWFIFLGAAMAVTVAFLAARFLLAPPSTVHLGPIGGSFSRIFLIQPRLWVFMMGKLLWPTHLSADYVPITMIGPSTPIALLILLVVVLLQAWLAWKNRMGALGVALYWLGLATVSNFIPLNRPLADRFYYLPMAGVSMQLLALLLMTLKSNRGFWMATSPFLVALVPLTLLTLTRENVFASDYPLWKDTLQASPRSWTAHSNFGLALYKKGKVDDAMAEYRKALEIDPNYVTAYYNLGVLFFEKGELDTAIAQYRKALELNPDYTEAHYNLGVTLSHVGQVDEAITQFKKTLELDPLFVKASNNLGAIYVQRRQLDEGIDECQRAIKLDPTFAESHYNLGVALSYKGLTDDAIVQYQKVLELDPSMAEAHDNLGIALVQKGLLDAALFHFQEAVRLKPDDSAAQKNLIKVKAELEQAAAPK